MVKDTRYTKLRKQELREKELTEKKLKKKGQSRTCSVWQAVYGKQCMTSSGGQAERDLTKY